MKIIAVGMNYAAHNKELHHTLELTEPTIFMKSDSSLLKSGIKKGFPSFNNEESDFIKMVGSVNSNV